MAFSEPQKIVDELAISEGSTVVDLGAGSGFYTVAAAHAVGAHGRVYAVDIQQELLSRLKKLLHAAKVANVEVVHGDIERVGGTRLREAAADVVIAANVLFQVEHKEGLIEEILRILKPGGRVLLVDWSESFGGMGPQPEAVVDQSAAKALFTEKGFTFVAGVPAGDHHYALMFRK